MRKLFLLLSVCLLLVMPACSKKDDKGAKATKDAVIVQDETSKPTSEQTKEPKETETKKVVEQTKETASELTEQPAKEKEDATTEQPTKQPTQEPTKAPTQEPTQPTFTVNEMNTTMYVVSGVNVRSGPSTDYEVIGSLGQNAKINVTGQASTGWYRIEYNGAVGYCANGYLSSSEPVISTPEPVTQAPTQTPTQTPTQAPSRVDYDPNEVAKKAVEICKSKGMITTEDALKTALKEGRITKEEYDEYYPLDGMEDSYYSVFVNVDLNKAADIAGFKFGTVDTGIRTPLSSDQQKLLAYCMYYGYSTTEFAEPTIDQKNHYIGTQTMVWVITEGLFNTPEGDSAATKICACAPDPDSALSYYSNLKADILKSFNAVAPSFATRAASEAPTYTLKWNESNKRYEYTLKDTNGVLSTFDIKLDGYKVEKNGNSVTISSTKVNEKSTTAKATSTAGVVETTTSCVFWLTGDDKDQEFVSEQPQADPISAYFKVNTESIGYGDLTKTDASTGAKVKGAVYGIYSDSACKTKIGSMTTDANGYAKSKELTPGTYYIKEISVPKPYLVDSKTYTLSVTAGKTTGIKVSDKEQKAKLTIYKQGEVLTGWNGKNFTYETRKLKGATFTVSAAEDIYRADGTRVYKKGDVVSSGLTTKGDAGVTVSGLYLGTYTIKETAAPSGYKLNTNERTVTFSYGGQSEEIVSKAMTVTDTRQKANVSVIKKDSSTFNTLSGGKYTIYAASDIKNVDGKVIVTKDTALQTVTTGTDGKGSFTVDLPINKTYYITETKAPTGYIRSGEKYSFAFSYLSNTLASTSFSHTFTNDRVQASIAIEKVDAETGKAVPQGDGSLEGAVYGLYAREDIVHPDGKKGVLYKKDTLVKKLTTDANGKASVKVGKYTLIEETSPYGYKIAKEISFEVKETGKVQKVVMKDEQVMNHLFFHLFQ